MSQYLKFLLVVLVILTNNVFGQADRKNNAVLTGNLSMDSRIALENYSQELVSTKFDLADKKSPIKAGLFSLLLPGAGQFYNGSILKSVIFMVVEAAVITAAVIYNKKGDDKTTEFQNFADQFWDVRRYAQWTLDNLGHLAPGLSKDDYNIFDNNHNVIWSELNKLETAIGNGFSHNLPPYGEQQYYELIGKYPQYSSGWDDFTGSDYHNLSPHFLSYSLERGKANDFYNISSKAVIGIYLNHVIAALEAAWGAARFNNNLSMNIRLNTINVAEYTEYVPTMNLKFIF